MVRGLLYFRSMARTRDPDEPQRLAAIDIGTNSIRMVVAEVEPDGLYRILDEERDMARLGSRLYRTGRLGAAAVDRALAALGRMKAIVDGFRVSDLRCIATAAVRDASNGLAFRREVQRRHKMRVETLSAEEEAQLAFQSALRHFDVASRPVAVADIGGGSLDVSSRRARPSSRPSLPLGCASPRSAIGRSAALRTAPAERDPAGARSQLRTDVPAGGADRGGSTFTNLAEMVWDREVRQRRRRLRDRTRGPRRWSTAQDAAALRRGCGLNRSRRLSSSPAAAVSWPAG
jgi:exopolyphosphatase/guanosine-5'-triphosphate,3'-diphosphate pyrophosphatase